MAKGPVSQAQSPETKIDILVLGASFAGIEFIYQLERLGYFKQDSTRRVVVVDKVDEASYLPLIHEEIYEPDELADPVKVRPFFDRFEQLDFVQAQIQAVDCAQRSVLLADGRRLAARRLVIALGSVLEAPASVDPQGRALVLKSAKDRAKLRAKLRSLSAQAKIAVIGGGLSGVELAAELAYRQAKTQKVLLVHAQDRLNCGQGPRIDRLSQSRLRALGVELCLGHRVETVHERGLVLCQKDGQRKELGCDLVCWAGGVKGPKGVQWSGAQILEGGWMAVDEYLRVRAEGALIHEHCYAIGDLAAICLQPKAAPVKTMRRAIEAIWQAKSLATQISHPKKLRAHSLRLDWPHGVSLGPASLVCYRTWLVDLRAFGRFFRRFLGRMYLRRYHMPPWRRS